MKKIVITLLSIIFFYSAHCQNLGLRANTHFPENREMSNAFGGGLYFRIKDSSEKFECLLFGDYISKKNNFNDCSECPTNDVSTSYQNFSFGISGLWSNKIYSKANFKFGPLINYNITNINRQGQISNWIEAIKTKYIGTGVLLNLQFQEIFKLPFNFDIFISPTYLINIKSETNPTGIKTGYINNLTLLNLQFGLSYKIK